MKPLLVHVFRDHVLIGAIVGCLLIPKFGIWDGFIFWVATVLIDIDHYFRFIYFAQFKTFHIGKMQQFFERAFSLKHHPEFLAIEPFHTIEFLGLFGIGAIWFLPSLLPIWWGFLFHIFVDLVHLLRHRAITKRCHSFVEYWWREKGIRLQGGNPQAFFRSILKDLR